MKNSKSNEKTQSNWSEQFNSIVSVSRISATSYSKVTNNSYTFCPLCYFLQKQKNIKSIICNQ